MKTPREFLLDRHRSVDNSLQQIRAEDLASLSRAAAASASSPRRPAARLAALALGFWQESIGPWRRVWIGLAPVWLAILALHLAAGDAPGTSRAQAAPASQQTLAALREQRELLAELLGHEPPAPADRPKIPGPRGEQRPMFLLG